MLLKVVTFAGDVAGNLDTVGKTYSGDLSQCGVRLLRGSGLHCCADTTLLRSGYIGLLLMKRVVTLLKCRCCGFLSGSLTTLSH